MPRKLVLALAITSLSACSHSYKPESNHFISKPLPKSVTFYCGDNFNEENCTPSNQKEVKKSVPAIESAQLPKGTFLKTATEPEKIVPSTTTVKVAELKTTPVSKTKTDRIGTSNETIRNHNVKEVAEFPIVFTKSNQPSTAVSNSPTIFNAQHSNTSDKRKICLDTNQPAKNRLALHPNWDSLKKIDINKAIFKQLFINEPLADDIAALSDFWFDGDEVKTFDNSEKPAAEKRDNTPNPTPKTWSRAIKRHKDYENYRSLIEEIAEQTQVDPALLHAIIQAESSYNPHARSSRGAVGLMQLMPATARRFGAKNLTDPVANVYAGARYLRYLLELFDNNKKLALAGYNAGEYAVKRHGNKVPPYRQTQKYVNKVMSLYEAHRNNM
jgi:hypothetical protein